MHIVRIRQRISDRLKRERERWFRLRGRELIHFLHIGKTGGTAVKYALRDHVVDRHRVIVLHPHHTRLKNVPAGERVFFFLRDPISRFVSAFLSRQRMGRPYYFMPWSKMEAASFRQFDSPEALALALKSPENEKRRAAVAAMNGIGHIRHSYEYWLSSIDYLESRKDDLLLVGFQETLNEDFERLCNLLDLPEGVCLPKEAFRVNRNPRESDPALHPDALRSLKEWYKEDYQLLERIRGMFPANT